VEQCVFVELIYRIDFLGDFDKLLHVLINAFCVSRAPKLVPIGDAHGPRDGSDGVLIGLGEID